MVHRLGFSCVSWFVSLVSSISSAITSRCALPTMTTLPLTAAELAALPKTNSNLETSFHYRSPVELAAWFVPATFRPLPADADGSNVAQLPPGALRVAPRRMYTAVAPVGGAVWLADAVFLAALAAVAVALWAIVSRLVAV